MRETLRVQKKGCFAIHDILSLTKYGDMERFVQSLRQEGCERVGMMDTTNGKFMSRSENKGGSLLRTKTPGAGTAAAISMWVKKAAEGNTENFGIKYYVFLLRFSCLL